MSLVNILKTAINKNDWTLVTKALYILTGDEESNDIVEKQSTIVKQNTSTVKQNSFITNKVSNNSSKSFVAPTVNKFVDDLTLEAGFIEKNQAPSNKNYRQPFKEADHFYDVKCSRCSNTIKLTKEEYKFKTIDSESAPFTCIKCIRNSSR